MMKILTWPMIALVRLYQWTIRPVIGANCRFEPSCSHYAIDALRLHGPLQGSGLAVWRILRCNPWNEGGFDPVPPTHSSKGRMAP
jgi:putative membrane protein insertion efficiency factor